jgi:hypothetical protein
VATGSFFATADLGGTFVAEIELLSEGVFVLDNRPGTPELFISFSLPQYPQSVIIPLGIPDVTHRVGSQPTGASLRSAVEATGGEAVPGDLFRARFPELIRRIRRRYLGASMRAAMTPTANSNAAEIAAAEHSAVIVSSELAALLGGKIQGISGVPVSGCSASGLSNELVLPLSQPCTGNIGYGSKRTIRNAGATKGVQIALVAALHGNELPGQFLEDPLKSELSANHLGHAPGLASGYVLMFTNGLRDLSGDTGQISDMQTVVKDFYQANLVVFKYRRRFYDGSRGGGFCDQPAHPACGGYSFARQ